MNKSFCACHTAALRIFVRSLAGPSARQPFVPIPAAAYVFADQQTDAQRQRPMHARATASYSIARFHTVRPRCSAQVAAVSVTPEAESAGATVSIDAQTTVLPVQASTSTDGQSISNLLAATSPTEGLPRAAPATETPTEATPEAQDAAQDAAPQYPGKNRRKKLRRQKEAEAAAITASPDATDAEITAGETKATSETDIGSSTSVTAAERSITASTTAEVAVAAAAASVSGTATKKEQKEKTTPPQGPRPDRAAKREKATKSTTKAAKAKEPKTLQKNTAAEPGAADKKERKEKKQMKQKAERAARPAPPKPPKTEPWQIQKDALREKFQGEAWNPRKKLSPDALEGIRALHKQMPDVYTTPVLAKHFAVSPEAIRRILKSKWQPSADEEEDRQERWFDRGKQVWQRWAALGKKPPKRWQAEGIRRENPRRARQQQERTRRQMRAAWQREEMGAMGGMGMLDNGGSGGGEALRSPGASGASAAETGDRLAGLNREPASDRGTDEPPHADQPRQSSSLGKRIRLAQQAAQKKQ